MVRAAVRVAHTSELTGEELSAIHGLLFDVFDDMTENDYEHALGGVHALAVEDGELIAHASVIQRRLLHAGRALRTGYVEGVAVRPDRQRQGFGTAVMTPLEQVIRSAYELGALGATEEAWPLYLSHGWLRWRGTASVLAPTGLQRTPDEEGWIFVLPGAVPLDLDGDLACDWRDGDVW